MKILELIEKKLKEKALKEHHQVVSLRRFGQSLARKLMAALDCKQSPAQISFLCLLY